MKIQNYSFDLERKNYPSIPGYIISFRFYHFDFRMPGRLWLWRHHRQRSVWRSISIATVGTGIDAELRNWGGQRSPGRNASSADRARTVTESVCWRDGRLMIKMMGGDQRGISIAQRVVCGNLESNLKAYSDFYPGHLFTNRFRCLVDSERRERYYSGFCKNS